MIRAFLSILAILLLNSCITYYKNDRGFFLPKHPHYSLKDKKNFVFPEKLDTANVYKFYGYYKDDILIRDPNYEKWSIYKKFYKKGRAFSFGTGKLEEDNLNPKNSAIDYYFYDLSTNLLSYETFVVADGGKYIIIKYEMSADGDSLISIDHGKRSHVYVKILVPSQWKKYKID